MSSHGHTPKRASISTWIAVALSLMCLMCLLVSLFLLLVSHPASKADAGGIFVNLKSNRNNDFVKQLPEIQAKRLHNADFVVIIQGREVMSPLEAKVWLRDRFVNAGKMMPLRLRFEGGVGAEDMAKMIAFAKAAGFNDMTVEFVPVKE
jgi:hypothetical protein